MLFRSQISSPGSYELFGEGFDEMKGKINYMWVSNAGYRTPARSMYLSPGIVEVVISFSQPLYSLPQNTFLNINGTRFTAKLIALHLPASLEYIYEGNGFGCWYVSDIYSYAPKAPKKFGDWIFSSRGFSGTTPDGTFEYDKTKCGRYAQKRVLHTPSITDGYDLLPWTDLTKNLGFSISAKRLITDISLSNISLYENEKQTMNPIIVPANAANKVLKWYSSNTAVAEVSDNGVVSAKSVGSAEITARATDESGVSASCYVYVKKYVSSIEIPKEITVLRTNTRNIEANVLPTNASSKTLSWSSDDNNIATVTQTGVVTGVNVGTTNITATAMDGSGVSATCKVTVNPVTINLSTNTVNLQKGSEYVEQTATVLPENYEHKDVVWTTSGNGVTSVDKDGHITANKPGVDTLRCSLSYDSHIYSECRVIVYEDNVVYVGGLYYLLDRKSVV